MMDGEKDPHPTAARSTSPFQGEVKERRYAASAARRLPFSTASSMVPTM